MTKKKKKEKRGEKEKDTQSEMEAPQFSKQDPCNLSPIFILKKHLPRQTNLIIFFF